ncbi:type II toxin-antitoxin system RelE/ParE family toxin [Mesorhizobium australicum]|nr:type II toxin-antitoxin system RelE/ParE family toxin [Mesorhizobium sp. LNHC229A00]
MKELRFDADDGVWRVAFALDRKRKAILLVAGDKSGVSE